MNQLIDFTEQPEKISPYKFGEEVKRENFVSFFILSLYASRGNCTLQKIFFKFVKEKTGFKYKPVFKELIQKGGLEVFTKRERTLFMKSYRRINKYLYYSDTKFNERLRDIVVFFDFDKIKSVSDFTNAVKDFTRQGKKNLSLASN